MRRLMCRLGRGLFVRNLLRCRTIPAFWRQFPAHKKPGANEKGDADNRRWGERREVLCHESYLDPLSTAVRRAGHGHRAATCHDLCIARIRHSTRPADAPRTRPGRSLDAAGRGHANYAEPASCRRGVTSAATYACFPACWASPGPGRGTRRHRHRKNGATRHRPHEQQAFR